MSKFSWSVKVDNDHVENVRVSAIRTVDVPSAKLVSIVESSVQEHSECLKQNLLGPTVNRSRCSPRSTLNFVFSASFSHELSNVAPKVCSSENKNLNKHSNVLYPILHFSRALQKRAATFVSTTFDDEFGPMCSAFDNHGVKSRLV